MSNDTKNIMCGYCDTPLETIAEPKPNSRAECPSCGNGDTFENVMKIVGEGVKEQTAIALSKSLKRTFGGGKGMKFSRKAINPKKRAFYVEMNLKL